MEFAPHVGDKAAMNKGRLEAFSDGVIAIIITIMVLELKVPHGADLAALTPSLPVFCAYVLSFIYVGIYWNNHHHLIHAACAVHDLLRLCLCFEIIRRGVELAPKTVCCAIQIVHGIFEIVFCLIGLVCPSVCVR